MADSTLLAIKTKVRRLTRSPSTAQLSDADLDQYINTSILYDFPEHVRLFSLRSTLTFYTQPGVDVYQTTDVPTDPLFNFKNLYVAVHDPVFIAGVPAFYTQWRNIFYGMWPQTNQVQATVNNGDGTTGPFSGVINIFNPPPSPPSSQNSGILQNSVIFSCLDTGGTSMILVDYPVSNTTGALGLPNQPQVLPSPYGQINYDTGAYTVNFPDVTAVSTTTPNPVWVEYIPFVSGIPNTILYYDNQFTLRPVPDKTYAVQIEVDMRPTQLISNTDVPQIEQWWQWIAYMSAKKIFEDRMDLESVQMIMPELENQMNFVNRTNLVQQANNRTITVYTTGKGWGWGPLNSNFPF